MKRLQLCTCGLIVTFAIVSLAQRKDSQEEWVRLDFAYVDQVMVADACNVQQDGTEPKCLSPIDPCEPTGPFSSRQACLADTYKEPCDTQVDSHISQPGGTLTAVNHNCSELRTRTTFSCTCTQGVFGWCGDDCHHTSTATGNEGCPGQYVVIG